jgi:hypothetical protein
MARQDMADPVIMFKQLIVNVQHLTAGIPKNRINPLLNQRLDKNPRSSISHTLYLTRCARESQAEEPANRQPRQNPAIFLFRIQKGGSRGRVGGSRGIAKQFRPLAPTAYGVLRYPLYGALPRNAPLGGPGPPDPPAWSFTYGPYAHTGTHANLYAPAQTIINRIVNSDNNIDFFFSQFRFAVLCYGLPRFIIYL